jgi:hypothetical protein
MLVTQSLGIDPARPGTIRFSLRFSLRLPFLLPLLLPTGTELGLQWNQLRCCLMSTQFCQHLTAFDYSPSRLRQKTKL